MRHYTQLTREQRYQISALLDNNLTQTEIAKTLGVHKSTISRELKRNTGKRGYRPKQAQLLSDERVKQRSKNRFIEPIWGVVDLFIKIDWSPVQISKRLAKLGILKVSHERIYQHIYANKAQGGLLYKHLRCQKKYKRRFGGKDSRGQIPNRVSIDLRPETANNKERAGDWELDTVIGKHHKQAAVTIVDRKMKVTLTKKVEHKDAESVKNAIIELLAPFAAAGLVHTLTADNGKEFAEHEAIAKALSCDFYFADPFASWQRGLNENTNGLIRQYCPKGSCFKHLDDEHFEFIMHRLNNRPRESLGMKTPNEVLFEELQAVALAS
ncbi:IS30 family transposase [Marinospirillum insulare]|uniref:IS30 family transposase n=4 Tax=Marinospirillum insulare TaxID=217169 RepID=A0ABQ6A149_9GAMM|nr:IS30 family transposase [Marinospirillum insulare]GLR65007.1 IS30 family transposase [Marinospirillum insulare]